MLGRALRRYLRWLLLKFGEAGRRGGVYSVAFVIDLPTYLLT